MRPTKHDWGSPARRRSAEPRLGRVLAACALLFCAECGFGGRSDLAAEASHLGPVRPSFKPNLVLIYLDDAGYADTAPTGAPFLTPDIDRLAAEGTLYTSFHVAQPVCSASRAALLTGTYPNRIGITGALSPNSEIGLSQDEQTLAEVAKTRGYATAAFGKWHLGDSAPFLPTEHGFDEFAGVPYSTDMWQLESADFPPLPFLEGTQIKIADMQPADQRALTADLTNYAVDFISRHKQDPFFLYLAHPKPHVPLYPSERFEGASGQGLYADVMMELDWSVGEVLQAIDDADLRKVTWVIVASDNGPWLVYGNYAGSAAPYREGKFTTFEGCTRVPLVMRLPGYIPAGKVVTEPFMNIDLLPTFAALAEAALPTLPIDGRDVWNTLTQGAPSPHDAYYFWNGDALEGVLKGQFKLHLAHTYQSVTKPGQDGERGTITTAKLPLSLFDLTADPGETTNLADEFSDQVEELQALGEAHRAALQAGLRKPGHR